MIVWHGKPIETKDDITGLQLYFSLGEVECMRVSLDRLPPRQAPFLLRSRRDWTITVGLVPRVHPNESAQSALIWIAGVGFSWKYIVSCSSPLVEVTLPLFLRTMLARLLGPFMERRDLKWRSTGPR